MSPTLQKGRIVQISNTGVAIVEDNSSRGLYAFTFDKIRNYRGQTIRELGLKEGTEVKFLTTDEKVNKVELAV